MSAVSSTRNDYTCAEIAGTFGEIAGKAVDLGILRLRNMSTVDVIMWIAQQVFLGLSLLLVTPVLAPLSMELKGFILGVSWFCNMQIEHERARTDGFMWGRAQEANDFSIYNKWAYGREKI